MVAELIERPEGVNAAMTVMPSTTLRQLPTDLTPELRGLLEDPMTHVMMARDGVELDEVLQLIQRARAVRNWRGHADADVRKAS